MSKLEEYHQLKRELYNCPKRSMQLTSWEQCLPQDCECNSFVEQDRRIARIMGDAIKEGLETCPNDCHECSCGSHNASD